MRDDTDGTPKFAEPTKDIRCPDCEFNGYLNHMGRPHPSFRARVRACETCVNGRIRLVTRERIQREAWIGSHLGERGYMIVSRKETLDPYMLDVPKPETSTPRPSGASLTSR